MSMLSVFRLIHHITVTSAFAGPEKNNKYYSYKLQVEPCACLTIVLQVSDLIASLWPA